MWDKPVIATLYQPKIESSSDYEKKCKNKLKDKGLIKYPAIRKDFPGDFKALLTIKYKDKQILKEKIRKSFDVIET